MKKTLILKQGDYSFWARTDVSEYVVAWKYFEDQDRWAQGHYYPFYDGDEVSQRNAFRRALAHFEEAIS